MLKNLHQFEHSIDNKMCRLLCDMDMPIILIKECLFQFQKHLGYIEDKALAQQQAAQDQAKSDDEPKVEEDPNVG